MDDILLTDVRDGVATVTLNRPRQMNALSAELRRRFGETLAALGRTTRSRRSSSRVRARRPLPRAWT